MIKKIFKITVTTVMMLAMSVSVFAAGSIDENEQSVLDELNAKKVPTEYVSQAKNYFEKDGVSVTKEQADTIITNIDEAAVIAKKAGIKSKEDLEQADASVIDSIVSKAQSAAKTIDLTVSYNAKSGIVNVKDSTGNIVATTDIGTKKTGADNTTMILTISVLGVAIMLIAVFTKRNTRKRHRHA